ncbi:MAG: NADH dehydrogenase (quinone) subunit D [candidate division Zixibacteria bacterium]|nr:NADH dehydrogenase (quinone) subunit D [candidate division Zixibacteria bacterium]MCI0595195.1 NADH dehydrogenase (quinone) subunit D [candidate division Zixibacteria bacterium]
MAKTETMTINMGPQHPSTHGVLRLILELDGETVVKIRPVMGYLHTGIEKNAEDKKYMHVLPMTDRMDYLAPMTNNLVFCLAVEKLLGIEIPPKAQWLRVLLNELTRIGSHCVWLGTHAMDIGAMSMFLYAFRERERILEIYEMVSGQRMMSSYFRIGGVMEDVPPDFEEKVCAILRDFPARFDEYEALLTKNKIWQGRTKGVAVISAEDAINCGLSGPSLRGSGVNWDIRKSNPYSGYEKFDFNVPLGQNGDVFDRYLVRMAEMRESLKIVKQALDGLPEGPWMARVPGVTPPPKEEVLYKMEALIFQFKIYTEGFSPPPGEVYFAIESPRGELGYYVRSDGTPKPYRIHFRAPSFCNLSALSKMVEGELIADVVAAIGSIDIVLGDVDR